MCRKLPDYHNAAKDENNFENNKIGFYGLKFIFIVKFHAFNHRGEICKFGMA